MLEQTITNEYNTFWLIIFATIVIIAVGSIIATVIIKLKKASFEAFLYYGFGVGEGLGEALGSSSSVVGVYSNL